MNISLILLFILLGFIFGYSAARIEEAVSCWLSERRGLKRYKIKSKWTDKEGLVWEVQKVEASRGRGEYKVTFLHMDEEGHPHKKTLLEKYEAEKLSEMNIFIENLEELAPIVEA